MVLTCDGFTVKALIRWESGCKASLRPDWPHSEVRCQERPFQNELAHRPLPVHLAHCDSGGRWASIQKMSFSVTSRIQTFFLVQEWCIRGENCWRCMHCCDYCIVLTGMTEHPGSKLGLQRAHATNHVSFKLGSQRAHATNHVSFKLGSQTYLVSCCFEPSQPQTTCYWSCLV